MSFSRTHLIAASLMLALSGFGIYAATILSERIRDAHDEPNDVERTLAGSFTLENGGTLDISTLKGKVVVVASWATWCPSCSQLMVDLSRAKERFGREIEIIAINRAEEPQVVKDYRAQYPFPPGITFVSDGSDTYFDAISGRSMPELMFYNKEGIVSEHRTDTSFDDLMTSIDTLVSR